MYLLVYNLAVISFCIIYLSQFTVRLQVREVAATRAIFFSQNVSGFMKEFEGEWRVLPGSGLPNSSSNHASSSSGGAGDGEGINGSSSGGSGEGCTVEHRLTLRPASKPPAYVSKYALGILSGQVTKILQDLENGIEGKGPSPPGDGDEEEDEEEGAAAAAVREKASALL
jgi:hypothetical protein